MHHVNQGEAMTTRRLSTAITFTTLLAGLTLGSGSASAGEPVDPDTLQPPPPPGAECWSIGSGVRCETFFLVDVANEPGFELPCGTFYETIYDYRTGIRWYDTEGNLVKRLVHQDAEGTWSLSPTGAGPTVALSAHGGWGEVYPVPGDESSAVGKAYGNGWTIKDDNGGVIAHIAGLERDDEFHGVFRFESAFDAVCAALTG
jgi:hypothetical protein